MCCGNNFPKLAVNYIITIVNYIITILNYIIEGKTEGVWV